jgi:hypothetical protein
VGQEEQLSRQEGQGGPAPVELLQQAFRCSE